MNYMLREVPRINKTCYLKELHVDKENDYFIRMIYL